MTSVVLGASPKAYPQPRRPACCCVSFAIPHASSTSHVLYSCWSSHITATIGCHPTYDNPFYFLLFQFSSDPHRWRHRRYSPQHPDNEESLTLSWVEIPVSAADSSGATRTPIDAQVDCYEGASVLPGYGRAG